MRSFFPLELACCARARSDAPSPINSRRPLLCMLRQDHPAFGFELGLILAPRGERGVAGELFEALHEGAVIVETGIDGDVGDGVGGALDGVDGVKHAHLFDEGLGGGFQALTEDAHEVTGGETAQFGKLGDGDRFVVVAIDVFDGGQEPVEFGFVPHDFVVGAVDGDEADDTSLVIVERVFAGKTPLGRVGEEVCGMHFIYQWLAVSKDEQVVSAEVFSNDFREKIEVRFADDLLVRRDVDEFPQRLAHEDVSGFEVFHHEEGTGQVFEGLQELGAIGELAEKGLLESLLHA